MILEQLRARRMVSGTNIVAIGFGPGLTAAAMLFRGE
jgi:predicted naringenin-chalcone synthase